MQPLAAPVRPSNLSLRASASADEVGEAQAQRRERARELRSGGALLKEIAEQLGVSMQSAYRYTRGLPVPPRARHGGSQEHVRAMAEKRWATFRRERDMAVQQRKLTAALEVGALDDRTLLVLGAIAYWCEGAKSKPWNRQRSSPSSTATRS